MFQTLTDLLPEVMVLVTPAGVIQAGNIAFLKVTGHSPETIAGKTLSEVGWTRADGWPEYLQRCAGTRSFVFAAAAHSIGDGTPTSYRCECARYEPGYGDREPTLLLRLIPQEESSARFVVLTQKIAELSREITRRQQAELELRLAQRQETEARHAAEAASRAKDEFLATLSHELRTPLNAMLGWARMLRSGALDDAQRSHALVVIERNADMQARLIDDLLDVSRIMAGQLRLQYEPVNLRRVIEAALDAVRPALDSKALHVSTTIDVDQALSGDPARLQQVVWNLLTNAAKFTPANGRITLSAIQTGDLVRIVVTDSGQGFPASFKARIFEPFTQADASFSRPHGGLGVGLTIVRRLVEAHHGHVEADSAGAGLGATFTVALPIGVPAPAPTPRQWPASGVDVTGVRILVVEDDPDSAELTKMLLEAAGAEVAVRDSAQQALDLLEHGTTDVLVSDIGLPYQDGLWLIQQVRGREGAGRRLPAVAVTAFATPEDRHAVLAAGFDEHVPKPLDFELLLRRIGQVRPRPAPR